MRNAMRAAGVLALAWLVSGAAAAEERDRAYLGVYLTGLSDGTRAALGLEEGEGILIERVADGQAADDAGLKAGDVLLELGGHTVDSSSSLARALERAGAGSQVEIMILRAGKRQTVAATLGRRSRRGWTVWAPEADDLPTLTVPAPPEPPVTYAPLATARALWGYGDPDRRLGIRTTELTGQLAEYFEVARGLLVTWVVPDSPAGRAGVRAGDVIVSLGGQPVARQEDLSFVLSAPADDDGKLPLEVVRRGRKESLSLEL